MAVIEGFIIGLGMVIFLGPVFFTLLQSTLEFGIKEGLAVALGIVISDVVVIVLCSFGAIPLFKNPENQFWLAVIGGAMLIVLGIKYMLPKNLKSENKISISSGGFWKFFTKGFLVNFVNPFVFIVWVGVIGIAQSRHGATSDLVLYLSAALVGIFLTDSTKVFLAHKIKAFLEDDYLNIIYKVIGVILIGFSLRAFYFAANL